MEEGRMKTTYSISPVIPKWIRRRLGSLVLRMASCSKTAVARSAFQATLMSKESPGFTMVFLRSLSSPRLKLVHLHVVLPFVSIRSPFPSLRILKTCSPFETPTKLRRGIKNRSDFCQAVLVVANAGLASSHPILRSIVYCLNNSKERGSHDFKKLPE